ncbi:MAG: TonB-dependent receptor family protein [Burkholderiaceae bacterium]
MTINASPRGAGAVLSVSALASISVLFVAPVQAQSQAGAEKTLPPIIVTATRFQSAQQEQPIAAQVITAEEIRASSAITVSEVLSKLGGVHTRINFTGLSDTPIDLRGFGMTGDQNTLVLLNGQRISENEGATARISAIPVNAIERIEILRGSGAVLYGAGATGGTINIITRSPIASPLTGSASVLGGSHGLRDVRAGMQVGQSNWGLSLNAQHYENDNYRQNNHAEQSAVGGELRFGSREDFVALGINADDQKARLPGARTEAQLSSDRRGASTPNDYLNSESQMFTVRSEKRVGEFTLAMDASRRDKKTELFNESAFGSSLARTDVGVTTFSPRILWTTQIARIHNQLTAGFDWSDWSYENDTLGTGFAPSLDETGKQKNKAFYLRDEMRFATGTRISLGGRRENVDQISHERLVPNPESSVEHSLSAYELALQQEIGAGFSAYGRIGRSFRVANIDENRCLFAPCADLLKPQRSQDKELGMQWGGKTAGFRAGVFEMDIEDEIHYNQLTFSNMNLSPTRHRGLELEGKVVLGNKVDLAARYTMTQAKFREGIYGGVDVSGNEVPLVPKHRIGFNVGWQMLASTRLTFNAQYVGTQRYDNDQANRFKKMPSYTVADIKLSHDIGAWRLAAGINNLFDEKYYSYGIVNGSYTSFNAYPEDVRTAYLSAEYRF